MVQPSLKLLAAAVRASPRLRKAPIQLTDAAAERIRDLLSRREKVFTPSGFHHLLEHWTEVSSCQAAWIDFAGVSQAWCQASRMQRASIHPQLCRCEALHTQQSLLPHSDYEVPSFPACCFYQVPDAHLSLCLTPVQIARASLMRWWRRMEFASLLSQQPSCMCWGQPWTLWKTA